MQNNNQYTDNTLENNSPIDTPIDNQNVSTQAQIDPNQYYDEYYHNTSIGYSADQIAQYEQNYDQNYAEQYYNYYNAYYQNQTPEQADLNAHYNEYQYYLQNYEYMKEHFPKKTKIIRWEEIDQNYNSLDQTNEYIEMLEKYQQNEQ